ncbi:hypothetical protein KV097_13395 [Mumia sp. zg.B17]|uniref:hypothetical protein n=2 Tax=unclassified Mumia TaxID=2621872 RepID=UPI001C6F03AF|nr:hypothetical protein [Mumia sp. zg.B17]MBW9206938.1 hypothetical protein [Mumia sp. zg.B17]
MSDTDDLLLPEGVRLIHIGPHKTGTTAIQTSLHAALPTLAAHGVTRAGKARHPALAVGYAVDHMLPYAKPRAGRRAWERLVADARSAPGGRVVVSSEYFSDADAAAAAKVVEAFGPDTHIVITLRPLVKILPSQWQQYVLRGLRMPYEEWLRRILADDRSVASRVNPSFWKRHCHDELVERWAAAAGTENVTVIVLDPSDRGMLNRTFERMLGLPEGTLVDAGGENRSFTFQEAEALRAYNAAYLADGQDRALHARMARTTVGAVVKERAPTQSEVPVPTPGWAVARAAEIGAEAAANIAASGVRIIGDLGVLSLHGSGSDEVPPPDVPPDIAGRLALAVLKAHQSATEVEQAAAVSSGRVLKPLPTSMLVRELIRRGRRRMGRVLRRG